jgi:hypothetical protein
MIMVAGDDSLDSLLGVFERSRKQYRYWGISRNLMSPMLEALRT